MLTTEQMEERINDLEDEINDLKNEISSLENEVEEKTQEVTDAETRYDELRDTASDVVDSVNGLARGLGPVSLIR